MAFAEYSQRVTALAPSLPHEVSGSPTREADHARRLHQINGVLKDHGLARPFIHVGTDEEIKLLGAGEVRSLGNGSGLKLVELPAQFTPDTIDRATGEVKPGAGGKFWTFFETETAASENELIVPIVKDAPKGKEGLALVRSEDHTVNEVNAQLAERGLKGLPFPAGQRTEQVKGISGFEEVNSKFFTVVIFDVEDAHGRKQERPIVYNANSDTGIDGAVFVPRVWLQEYGGEDGEPRLVIGKSYRPNIGSNLDELPRGFYNPSAELAKIKGLTDTDIPAVKRAIEEFNSETGIVDPRLRLVSMGRLRQDIFEASAPSIYRIDIVDPEHGVPLTEPGEIYNVDLLTYGDTYRRITGMRDAFTVAATAQMLTRAEILRLSRKGRDAQEDGEQLVLGQPYRLQHGRFTTEVLRTSLDHMHIDESHGEVAVNSGIARISKEVHSGYTSWGDIKSIIDERGLPAPKLVYPSEALGKIADGEYDIVTAAAVIKTLHGRGYLGLDYSRIGSR